MLVEEEENAPSGVGDVVGVPALRALYLNRGGTSLLLVYPVLETDLVYPLGGSSALARTGPLFPRLVFIRRETYPARTSTVNTRL